MKRLLTTMAIMFSAAANAQFCYEYPYGPFADPVIGMSTRLQPMAILDLGYSFNQLQVMTTASYELGYQIKSIGGALGWAVQTYWYQNDLITPFVGLSHVDNTAQKLDGPQTLIAPILGLKWATGRASMQVRYQGFTIMVGFGVRIGSE